MSRSGDYDDEGNRLVRNLDSNGRFHTDWLNMIYPRLKLAKDLLTDDGMIFISIDLDNNCLCIMMPGQEVTQINPELKKENFERFVMRKKDKNSCPQ